MIERCQMTDKKKFKQPGLDSSTVAVLSAKLLEANNELMKAEQERKMMLENISHDLRAPLTAIRSTVDYLKHCEGSGRLVVADDDIKSMLNLLDVRTRTLEVLVQDLYYLTCIEGGRDELKLEEIPLAQFLEEYFFAAEIDDRYSDKELVLEVPDDMKAVVRIDTAKMSRVLDNLFTNARKYSDEGARITLGAREEGEFALFYVRDTGYGIPEESIEHVFSRTFRVTTSRTPSKENSSGLGLAIAKSIAEQHGGSIECESVYGEGSIFTVKIPVV